MRVTIRAFATIPTLRKHTFCRILFLSEPKEQGDKGTREQVSCLEYGQPAQTAGASDTLRYVVIVWPRIVHIPVRCPMCWQVVQINSAFVVCVVAAIVECCVVHIRGHDVVYNVRHIHHQVHHRIDKHAGYARRGWSFVDDGMRLCSVSAVSVGGDDPATFLKRLPALDGLDSDYLGAVIAVLAHCRKHYRTWCWRGCAQAQCHCAP
ncbi:hypothetical protein DL89DRAFT_87949 [Linderina pennispora]|uniref:Uncharacterized protein n=1 Tax=Linderina pennispora TaxID=61395 RepID=A0A1Y1WHU7_9FUNG|nr:uncharacterized protein DL89DRAFT_87949 [Linderina pennispora]ORX73093.1 hypothetical protein DL89DRAFT_87949 [Linderina pennispora]